MILTGGAGKQTFVYDRAGFTFVGDAPFSGAAAELRLRVAGEDGVRSGDVNGDGKADFAILLLDVTSLDGASILL